MNLLFLLIGAAAAAAAPAPAPAEAAAPTSIAAPVKNDLRCFLLYAAAVGISQNEQDEATKSAGSLGVMYYFGKLKSEAPTLDLFAALHDEALAMESDKNLKEEGRACDTEFQSAGSQLIDLGNKLQDLGRAKSPTS